MSVCLGRGTRSGTANGRLKKIVKKSARDASIKRIGYEKERDGTDPNPMLKRGGIRGEKEFCGK